jgi:hypothetical protein
MKELDILKCRDTYDGHKIDKGDMLPSLPTKIAIIGKSALSGKSTLVSNLINRPEFYGNDFDGANIYLVSGSTTSDDKIKNMIKFKEIPDENIFTFLNDDVLEIIMMSIKEKYEEAISDKEKPPHSLVVMDDIAYSKALSKRVGNEKLSELFCNYRHYLTSMIVTAQKSTQLARVIRVNTIAFMIFAQPRNELEQIAGDICFMDKKVFRKMFEDATKNRHSFFYFNQDAPNDKKYMKCGEETNNKIVFIEN